MSELLRWLWQREKKMTDKGNIGASIPRPEQVVHRRVEERLKGSSTLDHVEAATRARRTWRAYDTTRALPQDTLRRVLEATSQSPTGFNLQGWTMVVVQDKAQRLALARAALGQRQVADAPATVVFAGDMEPERNAPLALEMGLEASALPPGYGPAYLRHIYYFLHGGPLQAFAAVKSVLSSAYSSHTSTPLLSVPVNRVGYAYKQTMIATGTFLQLATAAGWETCVMEGIDQEAVRQVVGLPSRFTVPVIVTVGYPLVDAGSSSSALTAPVTPRFSPSHFIKFEKYE